MAVPILRSVGQHLHPVGPLTVSNLLYDPDITLSVNPAPNPPVWRANDFGLWTHVDDPTYPGKNCVDFTVFGFMPDAAILYQTVNSLKSLNDYTFSVYLRIVDPVQVGLSGYFQYYDNSDAVISTDIIPLTPDGSATLGWIRPSVTLTPPVGVDHVDVGVIAANGPASNDKYRLGGFQLELGDTASVYNNGDMSGYLWSGERLYSSTLKTAFPSSFRAFQVGAPNGAPSGMFAHGTLTRPNVLPLQS